MIIATFYKTREHYTSFSITGHAGYADYGFDIVCASVSSLSFAVTKSLINNVNVKCDYSIESGCMKVSLLSSNCDSDLLIKTLYDSLIDITEQYSDYLKIVMEA